MATTIIDGVLYERKVADWFHVKATQVGGHSEFVAWRGADLVEISADPLVLDMWRQNVLDLQADPKYQEERALANAERAAKRAKSRVRLLCKSLGADTLITLTYRSNMDDLALCKKHLREFVRRVTRVFSGFACVCAFERQKRGAWHVHLATRRIMPVATHNGQFMRSYDLLRAIWRSVTKVHGGNVDVSARRKHSQKSPARIAGYLSKYILKAFHEGDKWANRWTKFGSIEAPVVVRLGTMADLREIVVLCYDLLRPDQQVVTSWASRFHDVFCLHAET